MKLQEELRLSKCNFELKTRQFPENHWNTLLYSAKGIEPLDEPTMQPAQDVACQIGAQLATVTDQGASLRPTEGTILNNFSYNYF